MNVVFLVGAPRSGTTWLQRMLGAHPGIASGQETQLFSKFVRPWIDSWNEQLPQDDQEWERRRFKGLPAVLTRTEFEELVESVVTAVYQHIRSQKPSASVVLDKTPDHCLHTDIISRCLPRARFLHLIRDGRDVAMSMIAASKGWGAGWAPGTIDLAAYSWRTFIEAARSAREAPGGYLEVRYEQLLEDGPVLLKRCLEFCGVPADQELAQSIYRQFSFDKASVGEAGEADGMVWSGEVAAQIGDRPQEPAGFYRKGTAGHWAGEMTGYQRYVFNRVAGPALLETGYASDGRWAGAGGVGPVFSGYRLAADFARRARRAAGAARRAPREMRLGILPGKEPVRR